MTNLKVELMKRATINCSKHGSDFNMSCVECHEKAEAEVERRLRKRE